MATVLGAIRLFMGATALFAPAAMARRLGVDPDANPAPIHPLRMFGIRTILIGLELLSRDGAVRDRSRRLAPLVHASDTASAALAGIQRQLPPRVAVLTVSISGLNLVLALMGRPRRR